jgi:rhodanese-related sulfurtransferase
MSGFKNIGVPELRALLAQGDVRLVDVRARHGEAKPSGAGVPASHLLPQSASYASNVSEVRTDAGIARGCIGGAMKLPLHLLPMRLHEMDAKVPTVFYCQVGGRSAQAAAFATAQGFLETYNLQGGIIAWAQSGGEIDA